jgi:hypothetical protein
MPLTGKAGVAQTLLSVLVRLGRTEKDQNPIENFAA